jgi:hypothetical protein
MTTMKENRQMCGCLSKAKSEVNQWVIDKYTLYTISIIDSVGAVFGASQYFNRTSYLFVYQPPYTH